MPRIAVLVPAYKRPEYTKICIDGLEKSQDYKDTDFYLVDDHSDDSTVSIFLESSLPKTIIIHNRHQGLRNIVIDFLRFSQAMNYEYIAKIDNDCLVPKNWLNDLAQVLENSDFDIVSANVLPSNAAFVYGREGDLVRPANHVGGLWFMRASLAKGVEFERFSPNGIAGTFNLQTQIIHEKDAKCGWVPSVTIQDMGHSSGVHPLHIKTRAHEEYSAEVRRDVSWSAA